MRYGSVTLDHVSLENEDLSNSNGECIDSIYFSNLANSKIKLGNLEKMVIDKSNISGIDLSDRKVNYNIFNEYQQKFIIDSDLSNTGITITYPEKIEINGDIKVQAERYNELLDNAHRTKQEEEELKKLKTNSEIVNYYIYRKIMNEIGKLIRERKLDGCVVNGKKIHTPEEIQGLKSQSLEKYNQFESNLFKEVLSSIEEQLEKHR